MQLHVYLEIYSFGVYLLEPLKHVTTAADYILKFLLFSFFSEKIRLDMSCESSALADDSHEMPSLISLKNNKMKIRM